MLTFLGAVLRVIIGFVFACLAAGFVQVLFAVTPAELVVAGEERLGEAVTWGLLSATQIAVFAAPFAAIAAVISEWQGLRSFAYHALVAMTIAVAGFGLIHATESATEASIVNSYAMAAYLTSGFVGGLIYWLLAGRRANRVGTSTVRMESDRNDASGRRSVFKRPATSDQKSAAPTENQRMAQQSRSTGTVPATKAAAPTRDESAKQSSSSGAKSALSSTGGSPPGHPQHASKPSGRS